MEVSMNGEEKERMFRYAVRKYQSLGPSELRTATVHIKHQLIQDGVVDEKSFTDLYQDLLCNNNWTEPEVLAYFSIYNLGCEDG
jgi:hypothetical protein